MVAVVEKKITFDANAQSPFQVSQPESLDAEFARAPGELREVAHAKAAYANLKQAVKNLVQAGAGAGNAAVGPFQATFVPAVLAAKDLADAGKYMAAKALLSTTLDGEAKKISDPTMRGLAQELSENVKANLDAIPQESYSQFMEGLVRVGNGLGWTVRGAAGAVKDTADTLVHAGAAAAVGGARGFVYAAGKAVSGIGYAVSSAFESAFRRLKAFFARLEARADVVQQGSIDLWKKTNELYAKKEA